MDKILSMVVGGTSKLNLMITGTETGVLMTKHDLTKMAGMVYDGKATIHKIEGMTGATRILRLAMGSGAAHLTFVTEQSDGTIHISNADMNRIIAHITSLPRYTIKMGVLEMPRLAA